MFSMKSARRGRIGNVGMRVECASGQLWVMQHGEPVDHFLLAGETFQSKGLGVLVVQALAESSVSISDGP